MLDPLAFPYTERNDLIIYKHDAPRAPALGSFRRLRDEETVETFTIPRHKPCLSESLLTGFEALLEKSGYEAAASHHAAVAVTEAVANALRHDGPVILTQYVVEREGLDTLVLLLHTPEGEPFDPRSLARYDPLDPANLLHDHRRGFFLMHAYAATLAYSTNGRETILSFNLPKTEKAINSAFSSSLA